MYISVDNVEDVMNGYTVGISFFSHRYYRFLRQRYPTISWDAQILYLGFDLFIIAAIFTVAACHHPKGAQLATSHSSVILSRRTAAPDVPKGRRINAAGHRPVYVELGRPK